MPKFLIRARYSAAGLKGLMQAKAASREKALAASCKSLGGKLEAIYFVLGDDDAILIVDMPGRAEVAALAVAAGASGAVAALKTQGLMTVAEMDAALAKSATYHPPGS